MALSTEARPVEWHGVDVGVPTLRNPAYNAFWLLRIGFAVAPILFGLDKFFDWMVSWDRYLWPRVADWFNANPTDVMRVVGGVEIAAGILVLLAPRLGSLLVAAWLGTIVTNLVAFGIDTDTEYWDIALRDFGLMIGALALFLLSNAYARRARTVGTAGVGTGRYADTDEISRSPHVADAEPRRDSQ
jgi:uncharacterized membrane protein YphA (DoxX/SURF4 family)